MKKTLLTGLALGVTLVGVVATPASANDVEHFPFDLPAGCGGVQAGQTTFQVTTVSDEGYPSTHGDIFDDQGRYAATRAPLRFAGRYTDHADGTHRVIRLWDGHHRFVTMWFDNDKLTGDHCYLHHHHH